MYWEIVKCPNTGSFMGVCMCWNVCLFSRILVHSIWVICTLLSTRTIVSHLLNQDLLLQDWSLRLVSRPILSSGLSSSSPSPVFVIIMNARAYQAYLRKNFKSLTGIEHVTLWLVAGRCSNHLSYTHSDRERRLQCILFRGDMCTVICSLNISCMSLRTSTHCNIRSLYLSSSVAQTVRASLRQSEGYAFDSSLELNLFFWGRLHMHAHS